MSRQNPNELTVLNERCRDKGIQATRGYKRQGDTRDKGIQYKGQGDTRDTGIQGTRGYKGHGDTRDTGIQGTRVTRDKATMVNFNVKGEEKGIQMTKIFRYT